MKIEMMTMKRQNKLGSYLAVTAGVGCAASVAEGAVVVETFTPGTVTSYQFSGIPSHNWGINFGGGGIELYPDNIEAKFSYIASSRDLFCAGFHHGYHPGA